MNSEIISLLQKAIQEIQSNQLDSAKLILQKVLGRVKDQPDALRFLGEDIQSQVLHTSSEGRYLGATTSRHDVAIRTLSLRFSKPFGWTGFSAALELLTTLRGPDMLRVKGIVNVEGKPVVVQGVQHIFSPPIELDQWPSADRDSRIVFITRNMESEAIRNLMSAVTSL